MKSIHDSGAELGTRTRCHVKELMNDRICDVCALGAH
jgi:hypothetical protein